MKSSSDAPPFLQGHILGVSISGSDELLALGFGQEHLREALLTVCRPLLRAGAHIAYGGSIGNAKGFFTRDLIELIASEQRDASRLLEAGPALSVPAIGRLYNPQPWPHYENVTIGDRARWIDACVFMEISQTDAGILAEEQVSCSDDSANSVRLAFNRAVVHSAMRRFLVEGMPVQGVARDARPRLSGAILLGGITRRFRGVIPGIFEEALCALRARIPVFILGGFGGAAARLAECLTDRRPKPMSLEEFRQDLSRDKPSSLPLIEEGFRRFTLPLGAQSPQAALEELGHQLAEVRASGLAGLRNGLDREQNVRLFKTLEASEAAGLIMQGLRCQLQRARRTGTAPSPAGKGTAPKRPRRTHAS